MNRAVNPARLAPPAALYSHSIVTEHASRWLHTSGVVPTRPDGTVPDGVEAQAATVWDNIAAMLHEAGMVASDVVSVTTYVVVGNELAQVMAARDRAMAGHRPASTLVLVPALAQPAWQMEISVIAAR